MEWVENVSGLRPTHYANYDSSTHWNPQNQAFANQAYSDTTTTTDQYTPSSYPPTVHTDPSLTSVKTESSPALVHFSGDFNFVARPEIAPYAWPGQPPQFPQLPHYEAASQYEAAAIHASCEHLGMSSDPAHFTNPWTDQSYQQQPQQPHQQQAHQQQLHQQQPHQQPLLGQTNAAPAVPAELRQNPRRSAPRDNEPTMLRQSDSKSNFVGNLVESSAEIVETIWPFSAMEYPVRPGGKPVLPLRTFISETLRRSRTSYSTLLVATYYLILVKRYVPKHGFVNSATSYSQQYSPLLCGRRMFLIALILASKYLQDRNYSARAWSKISGLTTREINQNELAFLHAINWKLHVSESMYGRWNETVLRILPCARPVVSNPGSVQQLVEWQFAMLNLKSDLSNVDKFVPLRLPGFDFFQPRPERVNWYAWIGNLLKLHSQKPPALVREPQSVIERVDQPEPTKRAPTIYPVVRLPLLSPTPEPISWHGGENNTSSTSREKRMEYLMGVTPPKHILDNLKPSAASGRSEAVDMNNWLESLDKPTTGYQVSPLMSDPVNSLGRLDCLQNSAPTYSFQSSSSSLSWQPPAVLEPKPSISTSSLSSTPAPAYGLLPASYAATVMSARGSFMAQMARGWAGPAMDDLSSSGSLDGDLSWISRSSSFSSVASGTPANMAMPMGQPSRKRSRSALANDDDKCDPSSQGNVRKFFKPDPCGCMPSAGPPEIGVTRDAYIPQSEHHLHAAKNPSYVPRMTPGDGFMYSTDEKGRGFA